MLPEQSQLKRNQRNNSSMGSLIHRLYDRGISNTSMPSLRHPLTQKKDNLLMVNLTSSQSNIHHSPKVIKKQNFVFSNTSKTAQQFYIRKTKPKVHEQSKNIFFDDDLKSSIQSPSNFKNFGTTGNFFNSTSKVNNANSQMVFTKSDYFSKSPRKAQEVLRTKLLMDKLSGKLKVQTKTGQDQANLNYEEKDQVLIEQIPLTQNQKKDEITVENYINLVMKNVANIDQFLYVVRRDRLDKELQQLKKKKKIQNKLEKSKSVSQDNDIKKLISFEDENPYQLQIVEYQDVKQMDKEPNFEYYTLSKKGFCHYYNGKPIEFIQLEEWINEKSIYEKIKKLKFFNRFRKWKMIKMWRKIVIKHYIQTCSINLQEKLFFLNPSMRECLFDIKKIGIDMGKSVLLIGKNDGNYSLDSFKHIQQKIQRDTSRLIQQFSTESRVCVKKCFQNNLFYLKETLKSKSIPDEKHEPSTHPNHKDNAFQALGFPAKMTYQHRSKLRKMTGKFVRFSYLVDLIHTTSLASIFQSQLEGFITRLQQLQAEQIKIVINVEGTKNPGEQQQIQKLFNLILQLQQKPIQKYSIQERQIEPFNIEDPSQKNRYQLFNPVYHIKTNQELLVNYQPQKRQFCPTLTQDWLLMHPNIDDVFQQLSQLIRQGLNSLKFFERWSKHREMQKYVNILQQWDDIVSDNWQIAQNDNLDPQNIIENYDKNLNDLKKIFVQSQKRISRQLKTILLEYLNKYWENKRINLSVLQSEDLNNPSQTIECLLGNMMHQLEDIDKNVPIKLQHGIFEINLGRVKKLLNHLPSEIFQNLKGTLPNLTDERLNLLNAWLTQNSTKLKEQIHNIDDFVRVVKCLNRISEEQKQKKDLCDDLKRICETLQYFGIDKKKRKQFETITLKAKDSFDQQINYVQSSIQRKQQAFTMQVLKYHIPSLNKQVQKLFENVEQGKFLKFGNPYKQNMEQLCRIQQKYQILAQKRIKCQQYRSVLKDVKQLDFSMVEQLKKQIQARILLWEYLNKWENLNGEYQPITVKNLQIAPLKQKIRQSEVVIQNLQDAIFRSQVLNALENKVRVFQIHIPLIEGFNSSTLNESHWQQILQIVKHKTNLDVRKKDYTFKAFIESGIGKYVEQIKIIFHKSEVEYYLQNKYSGIQSKWLSLQMKSKIEGRFALVCDYDHIFEAFEEMIPDMVEILKNPFAGKLKMYTITYESLMLHSKMFVNWIKTQDRLVRIDRISKILDTKKLPDYCMLEAAEKNYKIISKVIISSRNSEQGLKLSKLFAPNTEDKLIEINQCLDKLQNNFKDYLIQLRKSNPTLYFFTDQQLIELVIDPTNLHKLQSAILKLYRGIKKIQFQGEKIVSLITIDDEKLYKSPINITGDIDQTFYQITQTISENTKKMLRNCRYRIVEFGITQISQLHYLTISHAKEPRNKTLSSGKYPVQSIKHNIQFVLALNKADFSHYTQISIENLSINPQSLKDFHHITLKDFQDDFPKRSLFNNKELKSYELLIVQNGIHRDILQELISQNIQKTTDFSWLNQLKFVWDEQVSNTDEVNLLIRKLHLSIRYGNQFIGSQTPILMNPHISMLNAIKFGQISFYPGTIYSIARLAAGLGKRVRSIDCLSITQADMKNFIAGCYAMENYIILQNVQNLSQKLLKNLNSSYIVSTIQDLCMKKQLNSDKQINIIQPPIFLTADKIDASKLTVFRQKYRVIDLVKPKIKCIESYLNLYSKIEQNYCEAVKKIFQLVEIIQPNSINNRICQYEFLDSLLNLQNCSDYDNVSIFTKLFDYLRPKMNKQNFQVLQKHVKDMLVILKQKIQTKKETKRVSNTNILIKKMPSIQQSYYQQKKTEFQTILDSKHKKIVILTGHTTFKTTLIHHCFQKTHQIYSINLYVVQDEELYGSQTKLGLIKELLQGETKKVIHIEGVNSKLLSYLGKYYHSDKDQLNLQNKNIIIIQTEKLSEETPASLISFGLVNFQFTGQWGLQMAKLWANNNLTQNQKDKFMLYFAQILQASLNLHSQLSNKELISKYTTFFMLLNSLLPIANILQATIYAATWVNQDIDDQYLKYEYFITKFAKENLVPEGSTLYDMVYMNQSKISEGLMLIKNYLEQLPSLTTGFNSSYIITEKLAHLDLIVRRIYQKTNYGIYLSGPQHSGKSAFMNMLRYKSSINTACISITLASPIQFSNFKKKIQLVLQPLSSKIRGPRVNYNSSFIIVDDVSMQMNNHTNIQLIKSLLKTKKIYENKKLLNVQNVSFILAGREHHPAFKSTTLNLHMDYERQNLQVIFVKILSASVGKEIKNVNYDRIIQDTYKIYETIQQDNKQEFISVNIIKRIFLQFKNLKVKEYDQLEIIRFWVYQLYEKLSVYQKGTNTIEQYLVNWNLPKNISSTMLYCHFHTKSALDNSNTLEYVRDNKKIFNIINERIQNYNSSDNKRYGNSFQFINFDELISKIVKISNNIQDQDYFLYGRKGTGKTALVKIAAYLDGINFKFVSSSLKATVSQLLDSITSVSSYMLCLRVDSPQLCEKIVEFYESDFEMEIVYANLDKNKQFIKNAYAPIVSNLSANKFLNKSFPNFNQNQHFINPKVKYSADEIQKIRKTFKIVVVTKNKHIFTSLPQHIANNFMFDVMPQIPESGLIQYNVKLIEVDKVVCTQHARQVLFQIFNQSKVDLGLSLKMNDDCVRLFSSLVASLIDQIKNQVQKYEKTLNLSNSMEELQKNISNKLEHIHKQLREISSKIKSLELGERKNEEEKQQSSSQCSSERKNQQELGQLKIQKLNLQQNIQQSSAIISKCQKISEVIKAIVPHFKEKHSHISQYIDDRNYLQQCLAITACYFTFLSSSNHSKRSTYLNRWYHNINILNSQNKLNSVLPLFNLYKEQFNADYRDELEDFYQNMAIIYNSIKPVIIEDVCGRGRSWLQSLCSFVTIDENDSNFNEQIAKQLPKGTNIIIRINRQQVMNSLQNSFIETLLYLSQSTPTVQINGKQIKVDNETKVYLLLGQGVVVPPEIQNEFIIVKYEYSQQMIYLLLQHETLSLLHPQIFGSRKDLMQRIKKLKLQCAGIQVDLAQMLNQQFYPESQASQQKSSMKSIDQCIAGQTQKSNRAQLSKSLLSISDKKFIKMHNLSSKMLEKSNLIQQFQEKLNNLNLQNPFQKYYKNACILKKAIDDILVYKGKLQVPWPYFIKVVSQAMKRGLIKCPQTMVAFGMKFWGSQLDQNQYLYLSFLVIVQLEGNTEQQIRQFLSTLCRGTETTVINEENFNLLQKMSHIGKKLNLIKIGQLLKQNFANFFLRVKYQDLCLLCTNAKVPLLDLTEITGDNFSVIKIIGSFSECKKNLNLENVLEIKLHDIQLEIKRAMMEKMDLLMEGNAAAVLQVKNAYEKLNYKDPIKLYFYSTEENLNYKEFNINYQWNVTNQIDFMKELCNDKAELDGIAYQAPAVTSQKAIQTMIISNQLNTPDEIIDEQAKDSYINSLVTMLVEHISKYYQLDLFPSKLVNKNIFKSLQNLQQYMQQQQPEKQIIFAQAVFQSLKELLYDAQFPHITKQINQLILKICSKIKQLSRQEKDNENSKLIQQIVKQEVQLNYNKKYKPKQTFSQMIKTQSQFLALNLTWLAQLRSILGVQEFNPSYLFANYDQIVQLCSKNKVIIPVRKSRLQVKQIANPLYANKKKNNKNKNSYRVATEESIHPTSNKQLKLIHLLLQRQLIQLEQSLQFILNNAKDLKNKISHNMINNDFESVIKICHNIILVYYNTMPEAWKMSIKDMGTKSSQCMMLELRQLSNKKRRIHSKLRDKIALSSLVFDLEVFKDPLKCLQRYFLCEPNKKQPYYYLFGSGYENGLKIEMLYAVGWKTNNEGFGQNNEGKLNLLQSHSIVRKLMPLNGFFSPVQLYLNKDSTECLGKILVQTKKAVPTSIGKLYLQDPKSAL